MLREGIKTMASWVIHLRVAEQLWNRIQLEDRIAFVMGNIAPDSGIPNSDASGFVPSSEISHFRIIDKNGLKDVHEEQFIAQFFTEKQRRSYRSFIRRKNSFRNYIIPIERCRI